MSLTFLEFDAINLSGNFDFNLSLKILAFISFEISCLLANVLHAVYNLPAEYDNVYQLSKKWRKIYLVKLIKGQKKRNEENSGS